jgi:S1-C subfamily serine protease
MAGSFDDDVLGAVLEFAVLHKRGHAAAADRARWERQSLKQPGRGAFGMPPQVWLGPAIQRAGLEDALSVGRNADAVKRSLIRAFAVLERHVMIEPYVRDANEATTYRVVTPLGEELLAQDAYGEYTNGLPYVVKHWAPSVAYVYSNEKEGIGTGFFVSPRKIVTARHVLEELGAGWRVGHGENEHLVANAVFPRENAGDLDLAIVELQADVAGVTPMRLSAHCELLDEVVVFGYPPIPHTTEPHMLVNRGEVSAEVKLRNDYQAILVSCLLRGGYSGGPVMNRRGQVIGVVSRNLFKQVSEEEVSVNESLGFAAAVPAQWAQDLLDGKV